MKLSLDQKNILAQANQILETMAVYGIDRKAFTTPALVRELLLTKLSHEESEQFVCLFLDSQHRLIACETLFHGTIDCAAVYPREVIRATLKHNAKAVILAHNHPSGLVEPSQADIALTKRLKIAFNAIDVNVLDHMIVGAGITLSFAERGLI